MGLHSLVAFLKERLDTTHVQPTAAHRALARLPLSLVFTANFDDLLERAFREAGKRVEVIVRDSSIPFLRRGPDTVNIVKLYGDLGQPDTVVLARQQYDGFFLQRPQMVKLLETTLASSDTLYLGWSGSDPTFKLVFGELLAVRQEVCAALGAAGREREGKTLLDFFRAVLGKERKLVVILDQFEELFTRSISPTTQRAFWRDLGACLDLQQPEVRFVLSLREDFLPHLDQARRPVDADSPAPAPGILSHSFRLQRLDVDTARLAIVEPAARANCAVEPLLADVLLGQAQTLKVSEDLEGLDGRAWSLVEADGAVPPPSLQIVMTRLYRDALAAAGHALPPETPDPARPWQPPAVALTLAGYRATGGAGAILAGYIGEALARLGAEKHPGDRRPAAGARQPFLRAFVRTDSAGRPVDWPVAAQLALGEGSTVSPGGVWTTACKNGSPGLY